MYNTADLRTIGGVLTLVGGNKCDTVPSRGVHRSPLETTLGFLNCGVESVFFFGWLSVLQQFRTLIGIRTIMKRQIAVIVTSYLETLLNLLGSILSGKGSQPDDEIICYESCSYL